MAPSIIVAHANGIRITNVSLTGQNTTNQTTKVQFDVSWNNSWRVSARPVNWDAACVFVKFRLANCNWEHARILYRGNTVKVGSNVTVKSQLHYAQAFFAA